MSSLDSAEAWRQPAPHACWVVAYLGGAGIVVLRPAARHCRSRLFLYLLVGLRRDPLSQALPDAAVSYMLLPYVGFTLGVLPVLQPALQWRAVSAVPDAARLVRRYRGLLRGPGDRKTQAGAARKSRQIVGGCHRLGRWLRCSSVGCCSTSSSRSAAALRDQPASSFGYDRTTRSIPCDCQIANSGPLRCGWSCYSERSERRRPTRRSRRVGPETRRRSKGFRHAFARTWRSTRPDRCTAVSQLPVRHDLLRRAGIEQCISPTSDRALAAIP